MSFQRIKVYTTVCLVQFDGPFQYSPSWMSRLFNTSYTWHQNSSSVHPILHVLMTCLRCFIFFSWAWYISFQMTRYIKCCVFHILNVHIIPIFKLKVLLKWFSLAVSIQLDVLHLLSPVQKAQLMLYPETVGLNNESLSVVLGSLMSSLTPSGGDVNMSSDTMWNAGFPVMYSSTPQDPLTQVRLGLSTTH